MRVRIELQDGHMLIHVASVAHARKVIETAHAHGHRAILLWRLKPLPSPQDGPACPQARPVASGR